MADDKSEDQEPESEEAPEPAGGGKKKLIILIAALLLLAAGGGGAYFFIFSGGGAATATVELPAPPIYHDFQSLTVDLKTDRCRSPYLKFQPTIQLSATHLPRLKEAEVKIIDNINTYLRSQTRSDLVGKEGADKLRAGIIGIINREIAPAKALTVLFKEFIIQ